MAAPSPRIVHPGGHVRGDVHCVIDRTASAAVHALAGESKPVLVGVSAALYLLLHQTTLSALSRDTMETLPARPTLTDFLHTTYADMAASASVVPPGVAVRFVIQVRLPVRRGGGEVGA